MVSTPQDGSARGKSSRSRSATRSSRLTGLPFNDSPTFETWERTIFNPSIASRRASRARTSRLPAEGKGSRESALDSFTSLRESCRSFDPLGLCSRMFPDYFLPTKEETLRKSSGYSWSSAGMGYRGACSTAAISTWPNDAKECSLSEVLESPVPQRFFLSPRAARGILRRAGKRGRILPSHLQAALESLAMTQVEGAKMTSTSSIGCKPSDSMKPLPLPLPLKNETGRTQPTSLSQALSGNPTAIMGEAADEETDATISSLDRLIEKTDIASTPRMQRETISLPTLFAETSETIQTVEASTSPTPYAKTPAEQAKPTIAPTLSTKNEVASSSSSSRQKWMEQCSEMLMTVRRLTPTECETLQAFPKGWTLPDIEHWGTRSRRALRGGLREES